MTQKDRLEFHIHIDASWIDHEVERRLIRDHGFYAMDFDHNVAERSSYAPERHLTLKVFDPIGFKAAFDDVASLVEVTRGMRGYIEGEFVSLNETIHGGTHRPNVTLPVRFTTKALPKGGFRESEVHLTFRRSRPAEQVDAALQQAGFFTAFLPKPDGMAQVFTAQGSRKHIACLVPPVLEYLRTTGGFELVKVKEERIAKWWVSSPDLSMPPVIDRIESKGVDGVTASFE